MENRPANPHSPYAKPPGPKPPDPKPHNPRPPDPKPPGPKPPGPETKDPEAQDPPLPELAPETLAAIAKRHALPDTPWEPLPQRGSANRVYAQPDVVLRVPRPAAWAIEDALTESVAVPAARAAGLDTPELLACDETLDLLPTPYTLYRRAPGLPLFESTPDHAQLHQAANFIGQDLARLHARVTHVPDPLARLDTPAADDPRLHLPRLREQNLLDQPQVAWLESWCDHLLPAFRSPVTPRFLHNDVHELNILHLPDPAHPRTTLIDWGDAGWGDPAEEFAVFPLPLLGPLLQSYRATTQAETLPLDDALPGRILWSQIAFALRRADYPPETNPSAPHPFHRIVSLWQFCIQAPPDFLPWLPTKKPSSQPSRDAQPLQSRLSWPADHRSPPQT